MNLSLKRNFLTFKFMKRNYKYKCTTLKIDIHLFYIIITNFDHAKNFLNNNN